VLNSGTVALSDVLVHDNRAPIGGTVTVNGTAKTWAAGADGKAAVNVGSLAVGAIATLTYEYTSVAADKGTSMQNIAVADGTVTDTLPNPQPSKITSLTDTAIAIVSEPIPEAGEGSDGTLLIGAAILAAGAAGLALILRRRKEGSDGRGM
jgi:LPXTG-motif cell wall-anchored protein